mgnify:CR=1 FL=1
MLCYKINKISSLEKVRPSLEPTHAIAEAIKKAAGNRKGIYQKGS